MIEPDHNDAGLDAEIDVFADKLAHSLCALLASMRLEHIGGPMAREANRVAAMLERDRSDEAAEAARRAAMIELGNGLTVNLVDTVIPPTPEWLAKTPTRSVYVGADNWTDRSAHDPVRTVRRIVTSQADRAYRAGRFTQRQALACEWYSEQHELSGLSGNLKTSQFEPRIGRTEYAGNLFTPGQIEAQDELRNARLLIPMGLRRFFDKVVLEDLSVTAAAKVANAGRHHFDSFRCCADRVADYMEYSKATTVR